MRRLLPALAAWSCFWPTLLSAQPGPPPSEAAAEVESNLPDGAPDPRAPSEEIVLPTLRRSVAAIYPAAETGEGLVELVLTVDETGAVTEASVAKSAGAAFDAAAVEAARAWLFVPATRAGKATAARVRVEVRVAPEAPATPPAPLASPPVPIAPTPSPATREDEPPVAPRSEAEEDHDHSGPDAGDSHLEVTVHGSRAPRAERRAASDFFIHREVLDAAPHAEGADVLKTAPGLFLARSEGLAVAHSLTLRGFDSEHGQDIAISVGGLPINLPSHIHGQGYADLGFLIAETVDELHVKEGIRDPKQGDFAVAGSIDIGLGIDDEHRGLEVRSGYGSFDTFQQKLIWAPKEGERESFGAASFTTTSGFGENRSGQSGSGIVQHRFGSGPVTYRAIGFLHAADAASAGVVRRDDIDSGRVCFHCVYPYATATAQGGTAQRVMAGLFADYAGPEHASGSIGAYVGYDNFRTLTNNTGFVRTSSTLPGVTGRGDLLEQQNRTTTLGLTGRYRTEAFEPFRGSHGTFEVGTEGRVDAIEQSQDALDAGVRNQIWDELVDAQVSALDLALYGDIDWQFARVVTLRGGVRAGIGSYAVDDALGNFAPSSRPDDSFVVGFHRSAFGVSVGPRTSLEVRPLSWLSLLGSYGMGYRSPQARTLEDGQEAPFTEVQSADAGVRLRLGEPLEFTAAGYFTSLTDDVAYDPEEGRLERIGPTRRVGATAAAITRPAEWALGSVSVTWVDARLVAPPPATASEPTPPYAEGQSLPYVPPIVIRLDASVRKALLTLGAHELGARAGLGFSFLGPRPLPFDQAAAPVSLLDASLGLVWGPLDFNVSGFNLLDQDWAAEEYVFVSDWSPGSVPSRLPARHVAAGSPLSVFAALGVTL